MRVTPSIPKSGPARWLLLATVVAGVWRSDDSLGAQAVTLAPLLETADRYVARFVDQFSNVVAEEHYVQSLVPTRYSRPDAPGTTSGLTTFRQTRADFLLLRVGGPLEWRPYRDVFEADGTLVRNREDRLTQLFAQPSASSYEQAARIAQESARYNIGLASRTVNTPMLALLFLQAAIQPRFQFTLGKRDPSLGETVWVVRYREMARPTVIRAMRRSGDGDLPAWGRFWIEASSGWVVKTELILDGPGVSATLTTYYRDDARFGIAVPFKMEENYTLSTGRLVGTATYDNFRQFKVSTGTEIRPIEGSKGPAVEGSRIDAEQ